MVTICYHYLIITFNLSAILREFGNFSEVLLDQMQRCERKDLDLYSLRYLKANTLTGMFKD